MSWREIIAPVTNRMMIVNCPRIPRVIRPGADVRRLVDLHVEDLQTCHLPEALFERDAFSA